MDLSLKNVAGSISKRDEFKQKGNYYNSSLGPSDLSNSLRDFVKSPCKNYYLIFQIKNLDTQSVLTKAESPKSLSSQENILI